MEAKREIKGWAWSVEAKREIKGWAWSVEANAAGARLVTWPCAKGIMERRFECDFLGHAPLAARTRTGNDGSNVHIYNTSYL